MFAVKIGTIENPIALNQFQKLLTLDYSTSKKIEIGAFAAAGACSANLVIAAKGTLIWPLARWTTNLEPQVSRHALQSG
jgi:hypothetical protein